MPSMRQGQPPQTMDLKIAVRTETINGNIPESAFKFVPPKGAKEVPDRRGMGGPMGPMMGGLLGGPTGRKRP